MVHQSWILFAVVGALLVHIVSGAMTCVQCNSQNDQNCTSGNLSATDCSTEDDKCYYRFDGNYVDRGCFSKLNDTEKEVCNKIDDFSCVTCNTTNCNNAKWLTCHRCNQTPGCAAEQMDPTKGALCQLFKPNDQCYSKVDGDAVTRGCLSDLPDPNNCTKEKFCETCKDDSCNKESSDTLKTFTKCLQCKSTDEKCANGTSEATDCDQRVDSCYTRYIDNQLERGCLSKLPLPEQNKCAESGYTTCVYCNNNNGSACNNILWRRCHQCNASNDATCSTSQTDDSKAKFCQHYKKDNRCYERLELETVVRGCETDLGPATEDACKDNAKCRVCTFDACNKGAAETLNSTERCLQCNTKVDSAGKCLLGTMDSSPCPTASSEKCFSKVDNDGVLIRGCYGSLTAEEVTACKGTKCNICEKEGCNKGTFPTDRLRCYQCSSKTDKNCIDALTGEPKAAYCKVYKDKDQCYARIMKDVFERGCQSDLSKEACDGLGDKECLLCTSENCNGISQEKLKNVAGRSVISSMLLVLCSLVSIRIASR